MNLNSKILMLLCLCYSHLSSQVNVSFNQNIDVYKPYTSTVQNHLKDEKIRSSTFSSQVMFPIYRKSSYEFQVGLSYKYINFRHKNYANQYLGSYPGPNGTTNYYLSSKSRIDIRCFSHSLGVPISVRKNIYDENSTKIYVGSQVDLYLVEYFIQTLDRKNDKNFYENLKYYYNPTYYFAPVASQIMVFSSIKHCYHKRSSIGIRLQAGTNLYSNWDQFKRYAWLGVGLEWEIGKKLRM